MSKALYLKLLLESVQSQRDIVKLSDMILKELVKLSMKELKRARKDWKRDGFNAFKQTLFRGREFLGSTYFSSTNLKMFKMPALKDFLSAFYFLTIQPDVRSTKTPFGSFLTIKSNDVVVNRIIKLDALVEEYLDVLEAVINEKTFPKEVVVDFWNNRRSTLIHELTHAYDSFISSDKAEFSAHHTKAKGERSAAEIAYWTATAEVNARYAQAVEKVSIAKILPSSMKRRGGFKNFFDSFKQLFVNWDLLDKKQQERLTKRLFAEYNTLDKKQKAELLGSALTSIAWQLVSGLQPDFSRAKSYDIRITVKKPLDDLRNFIIGIIKKPSLVANFAIEQEGIYNALVELFGKQPENISHFAKHLKLTEEHIASLRTILEINREEKLGLDVEAIKSSIRKDLDYLDSLEGRFLAPLIRSIENLIDSLGIKFSKKDAQIQITKAKREMRLSKNTEETKVLERLIKQLQQLVDEL